MDNSNGKELSLSWPWKRQELIEFLKELSDKHFQVYSWIDNCENLPEDGVVSVIHFLFDDTDLSKDARSEVGTILRNNREADLIKSLCEILDDMIDRLGDSDSARYIADRRWAEVVEVAGSCLREFLKPA